MLLALWLSLVAAVIPTLLYVLLFYWADRYEREPWWLAAVAFLWGAIPAIAVSIFGEVLLGESLISAPNTLQGALIDGALIAPIVEEVAKGAALLAIFWLFPYEFDGVLDGLIYGALIGFGFAMTENFFYFIGAFDEGGFGNFTVVVLMRAVMFGLSHAFYTALIGIGFGLSHQATSRRGRLLWPVVGLCAAMLTHGLHNLGVGIVEVYAVGFLLSLAVAGAGVGLVLLAVLLAWQHERGCIQRELSGEVGSILSADEFGLLVGRWHRPLHRRKPAARLEAHRLQMLVELALLKERLRRSETMDSALSSQIEAIRKEIDESSQS
ncbi:MAG: PrsW family intramembrane metalloprotease [Caldilineaceae bacterium]|nr:PrsW family intramembrane metalloprotease [Caldilineaceae bacterium]